MHRLVLLFSLLALLAAAPAAAGADPEPPVLEPYRDFLRLDIPDVLANRELAEIGLVDVTAAPFNADPRGGRDSTEALQAAINFARDAQMVCFFPAGTYKVSDTLECVQKLYRPSMGKLQGARMFPCLLVGQSARRRPRIVLAPHSVGFEDPENPKYVIHFWAMSTDPENPDEPQPNISMNQMFVNIDVSIGRGNAGAVAIRHRAAQGSGVQDCTIDARFGLTGLEGGCGSGGSHANIRIVGGRIGLDLRETQPTPTICGITLTNQSHAAILYEGRQSLCAAGLTLASRGDSPPIMAGNQPWAPHNGQLCIVDSMIRASGNSRRTRAAVSSPTSVFLGNVYLKGFGEVVEGDGIRLPSGPGSAALVDEYARPDSWTHQGHSYRAPVCVDGAESMTTRFAFGRAGSSIRKSVSAHSLPRRFPGPLDRKAANVKAAPYYATGDGVTDDTEAIQRAIDENPLVLLPKGIYRVSRTIRLHPKTGLIGVGQHLSRLLVVDTEGDFTDAAHPAPVVHTADVPNGSTTLASLGICLPLHVNGAYALEWRCGGDSILRSVMFYRTYLGGPALPGGGRSPKILDTPLVAVRGHGAGRWYNFYVEGWIYQGPGYRHLLVEDTKGPLAIYQCNPEHARGAANMEIRNASNVTMYGFKGEGNLPLLRVTDSSNVRLFGYGGNAAAYEDAALFEFIRSADFLAVNLVDTPRFSGEGSDDFFAGRGVDPELWHMVREVLPAGGELLTPPGDRPVLYRRGNPPAGAP